MKTITVNKRLFELMLKSSMGALKSDSITFLYDDEEDKEYFALLNECEHLSIDKEYEEDWLTFYVLK